MEGLYGFSSNEVRGFISKAPIERQPSLTRLFEEARGVGLEDFALNLAKEGMSERGIYDEMWKRIETTGGYQGRR